MIVIAHLSDLHIDSGQRSTERAKAVMDHLEGLPYDLDAVLVTGDIADHALPAEYERARRLLTSRHPVMVCPGNHDERTAFRQHLLGLPGSTAPVNQVRHTAGAVIALCDSSVPGKDEGHLEDGTLAWLESVLAQAPPGVPVLVGFHHPPAALNTPSSTASASSARNGSAHWWSATPTSRPSCADTPTPPRPPPSPVARCWWHRAWCPPSGSPGSTGPTPRTTSTSTSRPRSPSTSWTTGDG